jgi:Co/Zn/Cd efflux system component
MRVVNGIILILMLLTIAMFSIDRFSQPETKDD